MALPASGAISFTDINTELGFSTTASTNLNSTIVRTLFGQASGAVDMNTGHGKFIMSQYPFSNYTVTVPGVGSGGGGPGVTSGSVKPTIGASAGSSVSVSLGLCLRAFWSDSNTGAQTYNSSRDAIFLSTSTTWNATDLANMGITYTDVTTTSVGRNISLSFNLDDRFDGGYYTITKSGTTSLATWTSGTYTNGTTNFDSGAGRHGASASWSIPAPTASQLIVLAYTCSTGFDSFSASIT